MGPAVERERGRTVCFQRWTDLLFVHWRLPAEAVRPLVPAALPLDVRDGAAWVGVVAFGIESARTARTPPPLGIAFPETNLRTYVRLPGGEPAVWFFSLDAGSRAAVLGARARFGLPYHAARMRLGRDGGAVVYASRRTGGAEAGFAARCEPGPPVGPAIPGTEAHFLVERYALHVVRGGRVRTVLVDHAPYPLRSVRLASLEQDLTSAAGLPPVDRPDRVDFADRVDVEILLGGMSASPRGGYDGAVRGAEA